jgi:hypothetical protein
LAEHRGCERPLAHRLGGRQLIPRL